MILAREQTAAFTGHRTYRGEADALLCAAIRALHARGVSTFLSGMAEGFDLAAAEAVLALREELPGLRLICVLPYSDHPDHQKQALRDRYRAVLLKADALVTLATNYYAACYHHRNDYLVDHASYLVAWYNGSPGGTRYTVRRAHAAHLPVENLWSDPQLNLTL